MKNTALRYLNKNMLLNFDMISQLNKPECIIGYADSDGVMLIPNDRIIMISVDSAEKCMELLKAAPRRVFCAHNSYCVDIVRHLYPDIRKPQICYNAIYDKDPFDTAKYPYTFTNLGHEHIKSAEQIYSTVEKPGYIAERAENGYLFGCFDLKGTLMGIGGIHDDGSIGMVHTFEKFRSLGVGQFISECLVNHELLNSRIPYVQINCDNSASIALYKKLKFKFSDKFMYWI